MRNAILLLQAIFCPMLALAQEGTIGVINDPDGYTNLRAGKGANFQIIDKILENELFVYYDSIGENWLEVSITRCRCDEPNRRYNNITGYMHRSRILSLESLKSADKRELFASIFAKEREIYQKARSETDKTTKEYKSLSSMLNVYHDFQFAPSLGAFERFICQHKDRDLMDDFLEVLEIEEGSADELPSFTLANIFKCDPDWTFQQIRNHISLMDQLEWGIVNITYEADTLKRKYNELRVSAGLSKTDFSLYGQ